MAKKLTSLMKMAILCLSNPWRWSHLGTETSKVAGMEVTMLVIRFEQDRMTLRVPMEKAISLGLAYIIII